MDLAEHIRTARWFGAKSRTIQTVRVIDSATWTSGSTVSLVDVVYADAGPPDTYVLVTDLDAASVGRDLLDHFRGQSVPTDRGGRLEFRPTRLFDEVVDAAASEPVSLMRGEQSNTSLRYGDVLILKLFRRVQYGPNPDVEIGVFLIEHTAFRGTPGVVGTLDYVAPDGRQASVALLQQFVRNRGDAWVTTLDRLSLVLAGGDPSSSLTAVERLASTTAELHLALASASSDDHAFRPERITTADLDQWRAAIASDVDRARQALVARGIRTDLAELDRRTDGIRALIGAEKTRHHGDYHLGQVLETPQGEFLIIDFEGEPAKPLGIRRERRSPLRDVAGLLRSLDYARHAALRAGDQTSTTRHERGNAWYLAARTLFLERYLDTVRAGRPGLLPGDVATALDALELEKAAYEVLYELNNRPDWLPIPLAAFTHT